MASLYGIKPAFVRLLQPLIAFCARRGITPNGLTGAALALSVAAGVALALFPSHPAALWAGAATFLVRMALNAMDGALARQTGQSSAGGEVWNEASDVAADAALYLPLLAVSAAPSVAVFLFVLLASWTELAGVLPKVAGGARRYDGPFGKSDRALAVGLYLAARGTGLPAGPWEGWLFGALDVLLAATCANRLAKGRPGGEVEPPRAAGAA